MNRTGGRIGLGLMMAGVVVANGQAFDPFFTITLLTPTNNTVIAQPGIIGLTARVNNPNTLVTFVRVDFLQGTAIIDSVTNSFFGFTWDAPGEWTALPGTNFLSARATDNLGNIATSEVARVLVNIPPTVSLTSPTNGQRFAARDMVLIQANATDSDGSVTNVQFFAGTNLLGAATNTSAPFSFLWTNLLSGTQSLTARARDNSGVISTSAPVSIVINTAPMVSITSPTNNTVFPRQGSFDVAVSATDSDGSVTNVQFFVDGLPFGTDLAAPYTFAWTNVLQGTYSLTARATDDSGDTSTSAVVTVTVLNAAPMVAITSPIDGVTLLAETPVTVTVEAEDEDGLVATVQVLDGTNVLGQAAAASSNLWTFGPANLALGVYHLSALATDNQGGAATSATVRVEIVNARLIQPTNGAAFLIGTDAPIQVELAPGVSTATVEVLEGGSPIELFDVPPLSFLWTNLPAGEFLLQVRATNGLGLATTSAPVQVAVLAGPLVIDVDPVISSRSGLLEHVVRLSNPTPSVMGAVRVLVANIPAGLQIFNATGVTNGMPFVQYPLSIQPGETVDVTVEFYSPTRVPPAQPPDYMVEFADPVPPPAITGTVLPITPRIRLADGRWLLEFDSMAGALYYIQFRTNMTTAPWITVVPSILGSGNRVQWVDTGPPRTFPAPETASERFYQVIQVP